jgi:Flp pilus assembly CpaE family ATPase
MSVRVATVLSARDWEPGLVSYARETAELRIVLRAFQPHEIEDHAEDIDVVVAGGEVSWVTPVQIAGWQRAGLCVLGIHPHEDGPAAVMLRTAGVDELLPDTADVRTIVTAIRFISPSSALVERDGTGTVISVIGPRGAPGTTEIALGLAWESGGRSSTVLIDLDVTAPSIAIRLGLPPRPDVTDVADHVRMTGAIADETLHRMGPISVITGSHRIGEAPLRPVMVDDVIDAAVAAFDRVVVDLGTAESDDPVLKRSDIAVLVVDASAVGVVRAAQLVSTWSGPPPTVVLNRVAPRDQANVTSAAREWTGIEPAAVIPDRPAIRAASLAAKRPDRHLRRSLAALGATL